MPVRLLRGIILLVVAVFSCNDLSAQIPWDFVSTNKVHQITLPNNLQLKIGQKQLSGNDAVGVFYKSGTDFKCGGYKLWKNLEQERLLKAFGRSGPNKPGFQQGDSLYIKVWDNSRQCGVDAVQVVYSTSEAKPFFQDGAVSRWKSWKAIQGKVFYQDSILCLNQSRPSKPKLQSITRPLAFTAQNLYDTLVDSASGALKALASKSDTFQVMFETQQCLNSESQSIIIADTPSLDLTLTSPLCRGGQTIITRTENKPSQSVEWLGFGQSSDSLTVASGGAYTAVATNKLGCHDTSVLKVQVRDLPDVQLPFDSIKGCEPVKVEVRTAENVEQVVWSNDTKGAQTTIDHSQSLQVTKTDTNGCQQSDTLEALISDPIGFGSINPESQPVTCKGKLGTLQFDQLAQKISGGTRPLSYQLVNTRSAHATAYKSSMEFGNLETGDYRLKVRDRIGCTAKTTRTFEVREQQCGEPVVIMGKGGEQQGYFIPEKGKAKVYNRNGKLKTVLNTPTKWFGRDDNGRALPIGLYHIVINNERTIQVTLLR